MNLKSLRQILKACADDTRLRIIHILKKDVLTVKDICEILNVSQPTISKHLAKLRLLKVVADKRIGNLVYYSLNKATNSFQGQIASFIVSQFSDVSAFKKDKEEMRKLRRK
jgi:ArsR family transcriptional regulator